MPIVDGSVVPMSILIRRLKRSGFAMPVLSTRTQRGFCRRLLEAAARRPGIGKAEVDLASASCRIEFAGKTASSQNNGRLLRGLRAGSGEWISGRREEPSRSTSRTPG